ncbi:MFS transporter [Couchioplanes caeruleus]|uniref:MFS transporter n=2 Tax=Couchioplanes caeruleus TaxID=56438 RepID=A0A1K0GF95_9ACTN|nr:MFS transporter [Couchioplanes caeruleus]OJF10838.1 hypothetical protein BG844_29615 [Couchioplanes caeruleus subsp. caeruleus]ROP32828.1 putative MFS family arabinose efflux permease [Couchioplanes caeruleus]
MSVAQSVSGRLRQATGPLHGNWRFSTVWFGQALSCFGDPLQRIAIVYIILSQYGDPLLLSQVVVAFAVPSALAALFGGVISDRYSPRRVMFWSDIVRALSAAALAVLAATNGSTTLITIVLAIAGTAGGAFLPASRSVVTSLVDSNNLQSANSLMQINPQLAMFIGAPVGTLIVAAYGPSTALIINAVSFIISAISCLAIPRMTASIAASGQRIMSEAWDGIRYLARHGALTVLVVMDMVIDFATAGQLAVGLPILAHERGNAADFGILLGGFGAGSILGLVLMAVVPPIKRRRGLLICWLQLAQAPLLGAIAFTDIVVSTALLALMAALNGVALVLYLGVIHDYTEPRLLGRVMALTVVAGLSLQPLAQLATGFAAEFGNSALPFIAGSLIMAIASAIALGSARVRKLA